MVHEESRSGDGKIQRGQSEFELAFVIPCGTASEEHNFDGKCRDFFAGTGLIEREQQAAVGRLSWANGFACQGGTPESGARGQSDLEKVALVIADSVAGQDED